MNSLISGFEPLSREELIENGSCCGSGCANCPYTPKYKKGSKKLRT